jgi:hypothetical protein
VYEITMYENISVKNIQYKMWHNFDFTVYSQLGFLQQFVTECETFATKKEKKNPKMTNGHLLNNVSYFFTFIGS